MTRLHAAVAPLLAVGAFAVAPALAQAEPYWTSNGKILKEGQVETVKTSGALTFNVLKTSVKCKVIDEETIENPLGGGAGTDVLKTFSLTACLAKPSPCPAGTKTEIIAHNLPWATTLTGSPVRDEITGMEIEVKCSNGAVLETYTGTLTPAVGTSRLEFGPGSGELENPLTKEKATITGNDVLKGPTGDTKIGAENVEHEPHWYSNGKRLAEGVKEVVATSGVLTSHAVGVVATLQCHISDQETIENPVGGGAGVDEVTQFNYLTCAAKPNPCPAGQKLTIAAKGLPWISELIAGTPIRDELQAVEVEEKCNGALFDVFEGTLTPAVGNSLLAFGAGSGELEDAAHVKVTITGNDALKGPVGDTKITAEDP
jgi:hypothetical protein